MERVGTGIGELDLVLGGGLPTGSLVIVAGTPGTGKTILAQQICFANATVERKAIYYTTWSEPHDKIVAHLEPFGFFDAAALGEAVEFIHLGSLVSEGNGDGLGSITTEVLRKSLEARPAVVVIDSSKALHDLSEEDGHRRAIFELASRVAHSEAVLLFVGEYTPDDIESAPEFSIADGIIQLANEAHGPVDRRWLRVLKMRGSDPLPGKHSFQLGSDGFEVFPRLEKMLPPEMPEMKGRVSTGLPRLDEMIGGGIPAGDHTLVLGPSGVGKTVLALRFIAHGLEEGEPCLYLSFQESEEQLLDKAGSFGWDLASARESGLLDVRHIPPVEVDLDALAAMIRAALRGGPVRRVVVDSLAELSFAARETERLPGYVWALAGLVRGSGASAIFTGETATAGASAQLTQNLISFLFHNVISLRYVELDSQSRRALGVLKMRDSAHIKGLAQFEIDETGFRVMDELADLTGILGWTALRSQGEQ